MNTNDDRFVEHCIHVDDLITKLVGLQQKELSLLFLVTAPSDYSRVNVFTNNIKLLKDHLQELLHADDFKLLEFVYEAQPFPKGFVRR